MVKGLVLSVHVFGVSSDIPGQFCPLQVISSFISLEVRTLQKFHLKNLAVVHSASLANTSIYICLLDLLNGILYLQ